MKLSPSAGSGPILRPEEAPPTISHRPLCFSLLVLQWKSTCSQDGIQTLVRKLKVEFKVKNRLSAAYFQVFVGFPPSTDCILNGDETRKSSV